MKNITFFLVLFLSLFFAVSKSSYAIVDPLKSPNNKIGIHILFTSELSGAASLVNSNGGDWGYVTIPIQAGDKNIEKWQAFLDQARSLKLIPIIRLSTEGDYFNTKVWRTPNDYDIIDFANFLNSLNWPTKNRYVVIFNEPNNADEWGGVVDPAGYAKILSYAYTVFKSKSKDFFIISAGMDNAAANSAQSLNEYNFLDQMQQAVPGIFNQIDGMASHSYPNPGFEQSPSDHREGVTSFKYEKSLMEQYSSKNLPVFITETGWSSDVVSDDLVKSYYETTFNTIWNNKDIVAVTPFLLSAGSGPFTQFSFLTNGTKSGSYNAIKSLAKIKGMPDLNPLILSARTPNPNIPVKDFDLKNPSRLKIIKIPLYIKIGLKWLLKL